jgi:hypothetical protein
VNIIVPCDINENCRDFLKIEVITKVITKKKKVIQRNTSNDLKFTHKLTERLF